MLQVFITFFTAISLSGIAAYYSVIGLAQIFPGSFWPIVIMGSAIEVGKLVTASWLYNNWKQTSILLKTYFISAILVIMVITSMGIFGFLSRAHIESNIVVGSNSVQLQILEQQETIAKERLQYLLKKAGDDPEKIARATDRAIQETQNELKRLAEEKLPLLKEENTLLAEIGPIKYVAELLYEKSDPQFIDKAVRVVILLIIFVFDPLAVLLLIAANQTFHNLKKQTPVEVPVKEKKSKSRRKIKVDKATSSVIESEVQEKVQIIPQSMIATITSKDVK